MAQRRGSNLVRTRTRRRLTSWEEGPGGTGTATRSAVGSAFIGSVVNPLVDGLTLARIRGRLSMWLSAATSAGDGFTGAFGIGKATAAATAAGIASVPTPITEQSWDGWLYWQPVQIVAPAQTLEQGGMVFDRFDVDSKAMRKLTEDDSIFAAIELTVEVGAASLEINFDSRILIFLS